MSEKPKSSLPKPSIPPAQASTAPPVQKVIPSHEPKPKVDEGEEEESYGTGVSFNSRVIAFLIDGMLAGGLIMAVDMLLPNIVGLLVGSAYIVTRDSLPFLGGQSIGKAVMKYRAVTLKGDSLSGNWKVGAIRNAPLLIPFFVAIECAMLLTREDSPEQGFRLGDQWAGTKVIPTAPVIVDDAEESD